MKIHSRGDEWSSRVFASMPSTAIFLRTRAQIKSCFASLRATQKFREHEQASTRLNFASKSSKGKILRAVKNFNVQFITPHSGREFSLSVYRPIHASYEAIYLIQLALKKKFYSYLLVLLLLRIDYGASFILKSYRLALALVHYTSVILPCISWKT